MEDDYEPEKPNEWCCTCEHCSHDTWYPGELTCDNPYGPRYDESVDKFDTCDWWKARTD